MTLISSLVSHLLHNDRELLLLTNIVGWLWTKVKT